MLFYDAVENTSLVRRQRPTAIVGESRGGPKGNLQPTGVPSGLSEDSRRGSQHEPDFSATALV